MRECFAIRHADTNLHNLFTVVMSSFRGKLPRPKYRRTSVVAVGLMRPYALDRSDDWHRVGGRVGRSADADRPDRARRRSRRRGPAPACPRLAARPPRTVLRRVDLRGVRRPDLATSTLVVAPDVRLGSAIDQHSPVVQSDEGKVAGPRVEQSLRSSWRRCHRRPRRVRRLAAPLPKERNSGSS